LISRNDICCAGIAEAILASLVPWQEKYDLDTVLQHSTFAATIIFFSLFDWLVFGFSSLTLSEMSLLEFG
jgi:hypothetical protein